MIFTIISGLILSLTSHMLSSAMDIIDGEHAIYISTVDITYTTTGQSEMLIKVFEDDLEIALQNFIDADSMQTPSLVDPQLIQSYFDSHMIIVVNGDTLQVSYLDQEKMNDSIWLHFTMQGPLNCKSMDIEMSHFMEVYPDQANIVSVKYVDARKYLHLKKRSKSGSLIF